MFSVGHLSDLHATPPGPVRPHQLINKRFFGWLSWTLRRQRVHRTEVLDALVRDLAQVAPDHVVITGDLTNIALETEFPAARAWLERLGSPADVSLVPGNHDAYVPVSPERSWDLWWDYIASDEPVLAGAPQDARDHFPTLRVRGPVAIVGVCSAVPTPTFDATGTLGEAQLGRVEKLLERLSDSDLCRVVSIHHPVSEGTTHPRRELTDAAALREALQRVGAELVVHGHNHRTLVTEIPGPGAAIPVVGVRSSSYTGGKPHKAADYHVYDVEPSGDARRFSVRMRTRAFDPTTGVFTAAGERTLR